MILSGTDIAYAYYEWRRTFQIIVRVSEFIHSECNNQEDGSDWLNEFYHVFDETLTFLLDNARLNPFCLIPEHFRHVTDDCILNTPDLKFIKNYNTLLYLLYEMINDSIDDEKGARKRLLNLIFDSYASIIERSNTAKNKGYLIAILRKEYDNIRKTKTY